MNSLRPRISAVTPGGTPVRYASLLSQLGNAFNQTTLMSAFHSQTCFLQRRQKFFESCQAVQAFGGQITVGHDPPVRLVAMYVCDGADESVVRDGK